MNLRHRGRALAAALAIVAVPAAARAQQLLNDPAIVARLRRELQKSEMTPDQVRQRLTAMGYPASMPDQVLGGAGASDSTFALTPDVFAAVRQLGVMNSPAALTYIAGKNPDS